ncbi:hypothetical protein BDZ94DRAFT_1267107 [Collybia nuda]|uniref:Uncharacterized protein n=1 Tax=Collybia nuda TaxID=64659 RepID=A0A9P5Y0F7_9AGAR|nr:hypothetical protein BDZ94DRAFT_1267107 [Collybia nuda]
MGGRDWNGPLERGLRFGIVPSGTSSKRNSLPNCVRASMFDDGALYAVVTFFAPTFSVLSRQRYSTQCHATPHPFPPVHLLGQVFDVEH